MGLGAASKCLPVPCCALCSRLSRRALVEREADINLKKNFKCTALHLAAHGGHGNVVEYLLMNRAGKRTRLPHMSWFHGLNQVPRLQWFLTIFGWTHYQKNGPSKILKIMLTFSVHNSPFRENIKSRDSSKSVIFGLIQ